MLRYSNIIITKPHAGINNVSLSQEWVQCLTVAVAHSQAKDSTLRRLAYGGSLGRLTQGHGRATHHYHASLNSNLALRTAV